MSLLERFRALTPAKWLQPRTLVGRVRWAFLVLALTNYALAAVLIFIARWHDWQWFCWCGLVSLFFGAVCSIRTYRRGEASALDDSVIALTVYIAAIAVGDPDHVGLFYASLFLAAFYGSAGRLVVLVNAYLLMFLTVMVAGPGVHSLDSAESISALVRIAVSTAVIRFVSEMLHNHEQAVLRENALRDGGAALVGAETREQIYRATLDTLEAMLLEGPRVNIKITTGDTNGHTIVAVRGPRVDQLGETIEWSRLPLDFQDRLAKGRAVVIRLIWDLPEELRYFMERHPGASTLMVTPLIIRSRVGGAIWVASPVQLPSGLTEGSEALAAEASLALEKADLAESLRLSEARFRHQALHDPLTDLANRTLFRDRVEHALHHRQAQSVAALFLDMDDFKAINDTLGHEAGDELLRAVSERLMKALRPEDTVARLGGDEFAILLEGISGPKSAARVAERILALFRKPLWLRDQAVSITTTVGIAMAARHHSADDLLRNADVAMYAAKQRQKGTYELFETDMHTRLVERIGLEADLRAALDRSEFILHFQPTIDLRTGTIDGVEVLIRWNHPTRGWVPPAEFIPKAEETGIIVPIGRWVLTEACMQVADWRRTHPAAGHLAVSVNLSARQLQDDRIVEDVERVLKHSGLEPSTLILEITESTVMADLDAVRAKIERLRELGVRIAIDDFGIGYSSLGYLRRLPIDIMKIDKSFVDGLERGSDTEALFHAILGLAEALDISAVAEGVEEREQVERLHALGCEGAQGFYFSRPIDADSMSLLLEERAIKKPRRRRLLRRTTGATKNVVAGSAG